MFVKLTQFAEQHNISGRHVRRLIQDGKITENSWKQGKRGYLIDPARKKQDMRDNIIGTPLQQKPTPPTWQIEGPFSELVFTSAFTGAASGTQTVTQNFENSRNNPREM